MKYLSMSFVVMTIISVLCLSLPLVAQSAEKHVSGVAEDSESSIEKNNGLEKQKDIVPNDPVSLDQFYTLINKSLTKFNKNQDGIIDTLHQFHIQLQTNISNVDELKKNQQTIIKESLSKLNKKQDGITDTLQQFRIQIQKNISNVDELKKNQQTIITESLSKLNKKQDGITDTLQQLQKNMSYVEDLKKDQQTSLKSFEEYLENIKHLLEENKAIGDKNDSSHGIKSDDGLLSMIKPYSDIIVIVMLFMIMLIGLIIFIQQSVNKKDLNYLVTYAKSSQKTSTETGKETVGNLEQFQRTLDGIQKIVKGIQSQTSQNSSITPEKVINQIKPYFEDMKSDIRGDIDRANSSIKNEIKGGNAQHDMQKRISDTIESGVKEAILAILPDLQENYKEQYDNQIHSLQVENNSLNEKLRNSDNESTTKLQLVENQKKKELAEQEARLREEMKQAIDVAAKNADEKVAAIIAESKRISEDAEKRIADAAIKHEAQVMQLHRKLIEAESAIYPIDLDNDPDFAPLKDQIDKWLAAGSKDAIAIIRNSLGIFCDRKLVNTESWQLALKNVSVGIVLAMSQTNSSAQEISDILVIWAKYLTKFGKSDAEYMFNLQIPMLGKPIDKSWMSPPKNSNVTTVKKIRSWAVYSQYGVRYNAEVE